MDHCEVPHEQYELRAPTANHGPIGLKFHPLEKANTIANYLETQFTPRHLCDHEGWAEARIQALLEAVDNNLPERLRPCDLQKLINSLKLRKACGIDVIPNECLKQLPRRPMVLLTHLINHCIWLFHYQNQVRTLNIPKIYARLAYCP
jgi:hypothetical protein